MSAGARLLRRLLAAAGWALSVAATAAFVAAALAGDERALAAPGVVVAAVCLYGFAYGCLALALTPRREAGAARRDAHALPLAPRARARAVPDFGDADVALVSAALFLARAGEREEPPVAPARVEW